jgi:membrane-associated protease RseP (regulator of RpoE activity)
MKKISVVAAFVLVLAGVIGGLYAAGVFTGGGSSKASAAASQVSSDQGAWLGVQIVQSSDGPTVASVIADSPAEKAGLARGDIIKAIDGTSVSDVQAVRDALKDKKAGDTITVSITRDGKAQDVTVTLETQPEPLRQERSSDQVPWLGVQIVQSTDGPTVDSVIAGSPAEKAGLKQGDVIKSIDGTSVSDVKAVRDAIKDKKAGDTITLSITRDGKAQDVTVALEAQPEPLLQENPVLPELSGIPADQLFSHLLGGTFQFKDSDGKTHTVSVDLGTVASVDADAKTISVDLNAGGSKKYTISDGVTAMPSDLTQYADGDQVIIVSMDGNLRALMKGPGLGLGGPFFGGMEGRFFFGGMHGPGRGGWDGFQGESGGEGDFDMPRGEAGGGL